MKSVLSLFTSSSIKRVLKDLKGSDFEVEIPLSHPIPNNDKDLVFQLVEQYNKTTSESWITFSMLPPYTHYTTVQKHKSSKSKEI